MSVGFPAHLVAAGIVCTAETGRLGVGEGRSDLLALSSQTTNSFVAMVGDLTEPYLNC